jgi:hypothetical protein
MTEQAPATTFHIRRFDNLCNTGCLPLAVRGWHEMIAEGHSDGGILLAWDQKVIRADLRGIPIGVLTWSKQDWSNSIFVNLAYVVPEMRRRGAHKLMFSDLVEQAKGLQIPAIVSGTHIDNTEAQKAMLGQGRKAIGMVFRYLVQA